MVRKNSLLAFANVIMLASRMCLCHVFFWGPATAIFCFAQPVFFGISNKITMKSLKIVHRQAS